MAPLDTRFPFADDSVGLQLWRVTNRWQAEVRAALKPFELTHVQFVLLASLAYLPTAEGEVTQRDLAAHAGTDPMMTSQVLRALEQRGLVERRAHPTDGRARVLVPTAVGVALVNRAVGAVEAVDVRFFAPLGADRDVVARGLARLASA